jgi:hypothetical protein
MTPLFAAPSYELAELGDESKGAVEISRAEREPIVAFIHRLVSSNNPSI